MAVFYALACAIYVVGVVVTMVTTDAREYRDYGIAFLWPLFLLKEILKALKAGFDALIDWD